MNKNITILKKEALDVLCDLIKMPSFSSDENQTASYIIKYLFDQGVEVTRTGNNVIARNKFFNEARPTLLLNSHHDTVKPNKSYTKDPFLPIIDDGKLYGLGSNDAGGCLVALMMTFIHFCGQESLKYNLVFAATAEEEISGTNGIQLALQQMPPIDSAIVGEPTLMQMAVAERGLMVLDCTAIGKAGHAAREEGENAVYKAIKDIEWIRQHRFERCSEMLGPVKMSVTSIGSDNKTHNIVPSNCRFVVDVRVNELYTLEEVLQTIESNVQCEVAPRSIRLKSSSISLEHPLVKAGLSLGKTYYGSPTTSDKALMPFPALKMGPGDSARSHTADEFIYLNEIKEGIEDYINLLEKVLFQ
jgi:acetylornithine deacetylase